MPIQQRPELVLKAKTAMMDFLPSNVALHCYTLGLADRKSYPACHWKAPVSFVPFTQSDDRRLSSLTQPASVIVRACRARM